MRTPEQLEWERASRAGAAVRRGRLVRLVAALLVGAACATGTFIGAVHFFDHEREAQAALEREGVRLPNRSGKSAAVTTVILFVGLPALVGTVAFFGVFMLVGGRVPAQIKSALDNPR